MLLGPLLLDPLTETEMLKFSPPIRTKRGKSSTGIPVSMWICYCGLMCKIVDSAPGGICGCGREWNVDRIDASSTMLQPVHPRYTFNIIVDRGPSWRVWRKAPVGIHNEFL